MSGVTSRASAHPRKRRSKLISHLCVNARSIMGRVESRGAAAWFPAVVAALLSLILQPFDAKATATAATTWPAGSNCTRWCGNIEIPYPFGIEPGCFHAPSFNLTCTNSEPPELFLGDGTVQVLEISVPTATVRINTSIVELSGRGDRGLPMSGTWGAGIPQDGTYFLSEENSILRATGCDVEVDIRGGDRNQLIASCSAICPSLGPDDNRAFLVGDGSCGGIRCCQANIDIGYSFYNIQIHKLPPSNMGAMAMPDQVDSTVYIVDQDFSYKMTDFTPRPQPEAVLLATLDWIIASNSTCPKDSSSAHECVSANSYCINITDSSLSNTGGYRCVCDAGYHGNPCIHMDAKVNEFCSDDHTGFYVRNQTKYICTSVFLVLIQINVFVVHY
jgi:hypothetical protein